MQTFKTSKAKENILGKIRKELNKAAVEMPYPEIEQRQKEGVYEQSGQSVEELFAENFNALGGKFVFCDNEQELIDGLHTLYDSKGWKKLLSAEDRILQVFKNNNINICHSADDTPEDADACITNCEAVIARTGSFIISSKQHMGRTSPVFYPVHIIIAYADQVVFDIQDAIAEMKKKYGNELPSMINLNTGPSRTADIEKTLVVGVHGPGEVFCFFVNR